MKDDYNYSEQLKAAIERRTHHDLSPMYVPKFILEIPEIPMTVNGKKTEVPVKRILSGQKIVPSSTIVNLGSLKWYIQFGNLARKGRGNHQASYDSVVCTAICGGDSSSTEKENLGEPSLPNICSR